MNDDGSVADRQTAYAFAKAHNYPVIDIASLVNYFETESIFTFLYTLFNNTKLIKSTVQNTHHMQIT